MEERLQLLRLQLQAPFHVMIVQTKPSLSYNDPLVAKIEDWLGGRHELNGVLDTHRLFILLSNVTEERMKIRLVRLTVSDRLLLTSNGA